jgi:metal-dependent amidase/aminoacylase/carboxypeptidase family protein
VIAVLGEYDALADLSQAAGVAEPRPATDNPFGNCCGHHLLGVGSLLAAVTVKDYLAAHDPPGRGCATTAAPPKKAAAARLTWYAGAPSATSTPP